MNRINSFLQKRKMHESHHGILMVIAAYVLSAVLLVFGSDVFYGMVSKADRINTNSYQETQKAVKEQIIDPYGLGQRTMLLEKRNLDSPWSIPFTIKKEEASGTLQASKLSTDTKRIMGFSTASGSVDQGKKLSDAYEASQALELGANSTEEEKTVETISIPEKKSKLKYSVTKEEVQMLERIVEAEASGEDTVGRILIVNVIFNRIADNEFPDSVEGVIFQKSGGQYQFSPIKDERYWKVDISKKTKKAVQRALEGEDYSEGALYFMARKRTKGNNAKWFDNNLKWLFKHGGHDFFKEK